MDDKGLCLYSAFLLFRPLKALQHNIIYPLTRCWQELPYTVVAKGTSTWTPAEPGIKPPILSFKENLALHWATIALWYYNIWHLLAGYWLISENLIRTTALDD